MGLDMYVFGFDKPDDLNNPERKEAELELGYWRKANHVHAWFVENVMGGEDTNSEKEHLVPREKLEELRRLCEQVVKANEPVAVGAEVLPTLEGFFFGSTDYDEWYVKDCEQTIEIVDKCLAHIDKGGVVAYWCWW